MDYKKVRELALEMLAAEKKVQTINGQQKYNQSAEKKIWEFITGKIDLCKKEDSFIHELSAKCTEKELAIIICGWYRDRNSYNRKAFSNVAPTITGDNGEYDFYGTAYANERPDGSKADYFYSYIASNPDYKFDLERALTESNKIRRQYYSHDDFRYIPALLEWDERYAYGPLIQEYNKGRECGIDIVNIEGLVRYSDLLINELRKLLEWIWNSGDYTIESKFDFSEQLDSCLSYWHDNLIKDTTSDTYVFKQSGIYEDEEHLPPMAARYLVQKRYQQDNLFTAQKIRDILFSEEKKFKTKDPTYPILLYDHITDLTHKKVSDYDNEKNIVAALLKGIKKPNSNDITAFKNLNNFIISHGELFENFKLDQMAVIWALYHELILCKSKGPGRSRDQCHSPNHIIYYWDYDHVTEAERSYIEAKIDRVNHTLRYKREEFFLLLDFEIGIRTLWVDIWNMDSYISMVEYVHRFFVKIVDLITRL